MLNHIADAESKFVVVNVNPDFCKVDGATVPFDISQKISSEKTEYAPDFFARGEKVLHVDSVVKGVVGNAGEGVLSGVSQGAGDVVMREGAKHLFVHGKAVCHHGHEVEMNVQS
jgi:hypothetical protein